MAARIATVVRAFGYAHVAIDTALQPREVSAVLFTPGRAQEARVLATALGIPGDQVQARPTGTFTEGNEQGDLWVLIGNDRVQQIDAAEQG
jgi:LytR cell envelope-related transcriptional attenuator